MKIDTIFFDAGGIILDESQYEKSCAEHITKAINDSGIPYTELEYWNDYTEGIKAFSPQSRQYVVWKKSNYNLVTFKKIWSTFQKNWTSPPLELHTEIKNVLLELSKKYDLVLAGQYGSEVYDLLDRYNINCFKNLLSQDDFTITKPDPRYLEQIAQRSNVDPHAVIMIGDRIDNDVIPATQLGMKSIFVKSSIYKTQQPRTPQEIPTRTIDNILDIPDAIKAITICVF